MTSLSEPISRFNSAENTTASFLPIPVWGRFYNHRHQIMKRHSHTPLTTCQIKWIVVWLSLIGFPAWAVLLTGCENPSSTPVVTNSDWKPHRTTEGDVWHTEYIAALAEAESNDLPVLIDFTGLDWCEPCRELRENVFDKEPFGKWARERCVLLEIDVPGPGKPRDVETTELIDRYRVTTFPTVLFVSADGEAIGRIPVAIKEPDAWLDAANTILSE